MENVEFERCYYCGDPAGTLDHARPQSLDRVLRSMDEETRALVVSRQPRRDQVPACRDCNCMLGRKWFSTLEERRAYVKEHLRAKHYRLLHSPPWTQEEIDDLGPTLKTTVVSQQRKKRRIEQRLRWPNVSVTA